MPAIHELKKDWLLKFILNIHKSYMKAIMFLYLQMKKKSMFVETCFLIIVKE